MAIIVNSEELPTRKNIKVGSSYVYKVNVNGDTVWEIDPESVCACQNPSWNPYGKTAAVHSISTNLSNFRDGSTCVMDRNGVTMKLTGAGFSESNPHATASICAGPRACASTVYTFTPKPGEEYCNDILCVTEDKWCRGSCVEAYFTNTSTVNIDAHLEVYAYARDSRCANPNQHYYCVLCCVPLPEIVVNSMFCNRGVCYADKGRLYWKVDSFPETSLNVTLPFTLSCWGEYVTHICSYGVRICGCVSNIDATICSYNACNYTFDQTVLRVSPTTMEEGVSFPQY